jgi:hypothetical protein
VDSYARLHGELNDFLRQHCPVCDERHLARHERAALKALLSTLQPKGVLIRVDALHTS